MDALEITRLILLALHILGLAAIIGAFFVQIRKKSDYNLTPMLAGAIVAARHRRRARGRSRGIRPRA